MTCTEFKKMLSAHVSISIEAERKRFSLISNKRLKDAGVDFKSMKSIKEVKEGWNKFNKYEADWEKYCRKARHEERRMKISNHVGFSHLAYNNNSEDL